MNERERLQKLSIPESVNKFHHGQISRRQFLKRCAEAGFYFSSPYFLSGCDQPPPPRSIDVKKSLGPNSAEIGGTDQQAFLKDVGHAYSGTTIRVISELTPPSQATKELMKAEFIPLTGINVEWEQLPLERVLAKIAVDTANKR